MISPLFSQSSTQNDLNSVHTWSKENKLPLNYSKCSPTLITTSSSRVTRQHSLELYGTALPATNRERLLGIIIDPKFNFSAHIGEATSRAWWMLGFVLRVTWGAGTTALSHLYTAVVLPHLEYCAAGLGPLPTLVNSIPQKYAAMHCLCGSKAAAALVCHATITCPHKSSREWWDGPLQHRSGSYCLLPKDSELPPLQHLRHTRSGDLRHYLGVASGIATPS